MRHPLCLRRVLLRAGVEDPRRERERDDDEPRGPHREGDDARVVREDVEEGEEGAEDAPFTCAQTRLVAGL